MASEVEYVYVGDYVDGLPDNAETPVVDDRTVVFNSEDGFRKTKSNANALTDEASESDLNASSVVEIWTNEGKKKLPGDAIAPRSVQDNVVQSLASAFDPTRTENNSYKVHELVMCGGVLKECIVNHYGAYDSSHFRDFPVSELVDLLATHEYSASGLDVNGKLKDYKVRLKKGDVLYYNLSTEGPGLVYLYLVKTENPSDYITLNTSKTDFVVDSDDYTILRVYAVHHTGEYDVDFKFSVGNELIALINDRLSSIYSTVPVLKDYMEQSTPYTVGASYTLDVPAGSMYKLMDYSFSADEGDRLKIAVSVGNTFTYKVYLLVNESTYTEVSVTNGSAEFIVDRSDYKTIRLYCISNSQDTTVSFEYSIVSALSVEADKAIQQLEYRTFISEYKETGLDKNGILKDYEVKFKKGELLHYNVSTEGTVQLKLYLIKTESPLVYITLDNNSTDFVIDSDDYTILRVFALSHTGGYNVDFSFLLVNSLVASVYNKSKEFPAADSDLYMCLPSKLYMVNGLPYNIYGDSVNLKKLVDVDFFTEPRTTSNFNADLNQIGKVCRLENLKDCSLRVGFADFVNRQSRLIYSDIDVVWKESPSGVTKNVLVVGDSITNRGSGYFAKLAAESVGATINGYGTMTNYGSFSGEGREGWTWANFIGKSNLAGGNAITPMGSGTSGSLTKNPFIRLATADDKANYPDFCFTSTGVKSESSYADDPTQTNYYIFDFQYYLDRFEPALDLDVITIALGTNDIVQNYSTSDIIDYAEFMVQRIKAVLPSVKICVLPSPAWGLPYGNFDSKVVPYIEAMKVLSASESFDIVGLWCFMSRCLSFGVKSTEVTAINGSTKSAPYAGYIHFDTDNGKVAYIEYGKILASYILNS